MFVVVLFSGSYETSMMLPSSERVAVGPDGGGVAGRLFRECRQGNSEGKDKHMGMRETKRLLGRGLVAVALSAFSVCGAAPASESQAEWNGDLDFLVRLGQERFDFYADMQLKLMARK